MNQSFLKVAPLDAARTEASVREPPEMLFESADLAIAILIPCRNESESIAKVVRECAAVVRGARIFVYDNGSTDATAAVASDAGAIVRSEPWPGKGNVVRRMFADVDAHVYVMIDGDGTYDIGALPNMIRRLVTDHLDMVVGTRGGIYTQAYRFGHGVGNRAFNVLYRSLFGRMFTDIFSGYRVFSRRFVKSFPTVSTGFEIETEMSIYAVQLRLPVAEMPTRYGERHPSSASKLRTVRDSLSISGTLLLLFKEVHPARFFGAVSILLAATSLVLGYPLLTTFIETGFVPRLPTGVLATGIMLLAAIALVSGLILDSVARGRLEQKRLWYLSHPHLGRTDRS